ncbi:MAG: SLC13 family permease, partial [Deltaproteobacteria bacterium]
LIQVAGTSPTRLILVSSLVIAPFSAFINNTPIVVLFVPIILSVASQLGISPSKLLIPASYAAIVGGTCTLIGTSTNIVVGAMVSDVWKISIFEFAHLGLIYVAICIVYLVTVGHRLLPERETLSYQIQEGRLREYVTEVEITPRASLVGKPLGKTFLVAHPGIKIVQVIRGDEILWPPYDELILEPHDLLILRGNASDIFALRERKDLNFIPDEAAEELKITPMEATLAELVIMPNSPLIGRTLKGFGFRERYGVVALAIMRHDEHLREKASEVRLRLGDILLISGDIHRIQALRNSEDFLLLEGVDDTIVQKDKAKVALTIIAAVVLLAAFDVMPILPLAISGGIAMVLTGCLPLKHAYRSIDVSIIMLIAGTLSLGKALDKTGAAHLVAEGMVDLLGGFGPVVLLSGTYFLTMVLTELMSNTASAALMTPIALNIAATFHVDPKPFIIAIIFSASASFSTPIGYQTNTFVYGPGGYRFLDYFKVGAPLNLILWLTASLLIPRFWPL